MKRSIAGFLFVALSGLANGQTFHVASLKPDNGAFVRGVTGRPGGPRNTISRLNLTPASPARCKR
jgi:hypothetical protein